MAGASGSAQAGPQGVEWQAWLENKRLWLFHGLVQLCSSAASLLVCSMV